MEQTTQVEWGKKKKEENLSRDYASSRPTSWWQWKVVSACHLNVLCWLQNGIIWIWTD